MKNMVCAWVWLVVVFACALAVAGAGDAPFLCTVGACTGTSCVLQIKEGSGDIEALAGTIAGLSISTAVLTLYGAVACFTIGAERYRRRW